MYVCVRMCADFLVCGFFSSELPGIDMVLNIFPCSALQKRMRVPPDFVQINVGTVLLIMTLGHYDLGW